MIYILSLITLIAIIQAYRSYPVIPFSAYTHEVYELEFCVTAEAMEDFYLFPTIPTKRT